MPGLRLASAAAKGKFDRLMVSQGSSHSEAGKEKDLDGQKTVPVNVSSNDAYHIRDALKKGEAPEYLIHHFQRVVNFFEAQESLSAAKGWVQSGEIDRSRTLADLG
jgi:hypothetical protein